MDCGKRTNDWQRAEPEDAAGGCCLGEARIGINRIRLTSLQVLLQSGMRTRTWICEREHRPRLRFVVAAG